jgi:hypothetical protein
MPLDSVRIQAVSSGVAHDPSTDDDHPPAFPTIELVTDAESRTVAHVWHRTDDADLGTGPLARALRNAEGPPGLFDVPGPWRVRFQAERGASAEVVFPALVSWPEHDDPTIRNYSGIAEYFCTFAPPEALLTDDLAVVLDLGRVAGVARVTLNGRELGVLWKPPYAVRVAGLLRPGDNELRVAIANTWHNRLVGDASLEPDQRFTSTNVRRPFTPDTPLLESGLLGPVRLHAARIVPLEAAPRRR